MPLAVTALAIGLLAQLQPLPAQLIALDSEEGRRLLAESGPSFDFVPLASHFASQPTMTYCGVTSAVMVLNALPLAAPEVPGWAPFRAFTEDNVLAAGEKAGVEAATVAQMGATIDELAAIVGASGASAEPIFASASTEAELRRQGAAAVADQNHFMLVDFLRAELGQDSGAHWSPVAAYHAGTDRFLILDVARYRYPPYWVRTADLFKAMSTPDPVSGKSRGWLLISRGAGAPARVAIRPMGNGFARRLFVIAAGIFLGGAVLGAAVTWLAMRRRRRA